MNNINDLMAIVNRLASDPNRIAQLIKDRGIEGDKLHAALDLQQEIEVQFAGKVASAKRADGQPAFSNRELRDAELNRLLESNQEYTRLLTEVEEARNKIREVDAEIESAGRRNNSDQKIVALVTSMISASMISEAQDIIGAYTSTTTTTKIAENNNQNQGDTNELANSDSKNIYFVTEAREAKTPGTVRAYCKDTNGNAIVIFAKNGNGRILSNSVNKYVEIPSYSRVDRGIFANDVKAV